MKISLVKEIENEDGTFTWVLEYDKEFARHVRTAMGWKRVSKKRLEKFVREALEQFLKENS